MVWSYSTGNPVKNFQQLSVIFLKRIINTCKKKTCDETFKGIKSILISNPVLSSPDFTKQFKLAVDARDVGTSAVLLQEDDEGIEKTVIFQKN